MKKIDIMVIMELFNIRNRKKYPKQVIKDFSEFVLDLLDTSICSRHYNLYKTEEGFFRVYRELMLSMSPIEFRIRQDFLDYLSKFSKFIYPDKF